MQDRLTEFDSGVSRSELFADGQRTSSTLRDPEDVKNWETISTLFEAGQMVQKRVEADNGDVSLSLYTDGVRDQLLQYDGNESASWQVQVSDLPAEGGRVVTQYNSGDQIPEAILSCFPALKRVAERTEMVLDFDDGVRFDDGDAMLDGNFVVSIGKGKYDIQGILMTSEYGGATPDGDLEAFNSWGATVGFSRADGAEFDFASLSLANSSRSDIANVPRENWANTVTVNGYNDDMLVQSLEINLTFDHVTHTLNWQEMDHIEFVATGGGITNTHVENAGWFSMDDLVFLV